MTSGDREAEVRLEGTSLKIYVLLLESDQPLGVREVARILGLSPSTVHYHLSRLARAGLVKETSSGFVVVGRVRIEGFYYIAGRLVPRLFIYSFLFAGASLAGLASLVARGVTPEGVSLVLVSLTAAAVTLFEGLNARSRLLGGRS